MGRFASIEDEWRAYLLGDHPGTKRARRILRFVPSGPRCMSCFAPFGLPGRALVRRFGFRPWEKNPKLCKACVVRLARHGPAGAEVEISLLFADVRGSSDLARKLGAGEFSRLMSRFYEVASQVLVGHDALLDKFVGDEAIGLFVPAFAGTEHARRAVEAARALLHATGHGTSAGPWVPLGASVHTGTAYVGVTITRGEGEDFTALGEAVNTAAHLTSMAGAGEILLTEATAEAAGLVPEVLEQRTLSLKGYPIQARVLAVGYELAEGGPAGSSRP